MARPRKIVEKLDTAYFENVTAIWNKPTIVGDGLLQELWKHMPHQRQLSWATPDQRRDSKAAIIAALKAGGYSAGRIDEIWIEKIDDRYHRAANELAVWKPNVDGWSRDGWARHSENIFFAVRTELIEICDAWSTYDWDSLDRERHRLSQYWSGGPVWIGEFQWCALPSELPPRAALVGLCLADAVAQFASGKTAQNVRCGPAKCDMAKHTPWKAILEFIEVVFGPDDRWDNISFRTEVVYHSGRIEKFYRTPYR
jgi:hypothetical protein